MKKIIKVGRIFILVRPTILYFCVSCLIGFLIFNLNIPSVIFWYIMGALAVLPIGLSLLMYKNYNFIQRLI